MFNNILQHPIGKRILKGSFWSLFGTAIGKFFILISSIFCARILGEYEYGELGIIRSTIAMFIVVGTAGISVTASKYISQYRANNEVHNIISIAHVSRIFAILFGLVITMGVYATSNFIAEITLKAPELSSDLKCGAILLFFSIFNAYQNGVLSGFENFKAIGINTLISGIFEFIFIITGAYFYSVSGAMIGYGVSFVVLSILNSLSIRSTFHKFNIIEYSKFINKEHITLLWKFALPAALNAIIVTGVFWGIKTMLINFNGFDELGIYEAADQWKVIMLYIPSALSTILLPILSNVSSGGASTNKLIKYNLIINGVLSFIFAGIVILCSNIIMGFYGIGFKNPIPLIILAISTIFTTIALVTTTAMTSKARIWQNFGFQIMWGLIMLVSAYYFLNYGLGATGIALSILIAYSILAICQTIYYYKYES